MSKGESISSAYQLQKELIKAQKNHAEEIEHLKEDFRYHSKRLEHYIGWLHVARTPLMNKVARMKITIKRQAENIKAYKKDDEIVVLHEELVKERRVSTLLRLDRKGLKKRLVRMKAKRTNYARYYIDKQKPHHVKVREEEREIDRIRRDNNIGD